MRIPEAYDLGMLTEAVTKKLFTRDEYHRIWDAGILPEAGRFELIRGEIIEMPRAGSVWALWVLLI